MVSSQKFNIYRGERCWGQWGKTLEIGPNKHYHLLYNQIQSNFKEILLYLVENVSGVWLMVAKALLGVWLLTDPYQKSPPPTFSMIIIVT